MTDTTDDLTLWGAVPADEVVDLPQCRRIGDKLFVRTPDAEPGSAVRLPLRLPVDVMKAAMLAGDGVEQTGYVIDELGSDDARTMWDGLDYVGRATIAAAYFREIQALTGMAAGESSR